MESLPASPQRHHSTYSDEEFREETLRSKRSSIVINWSDGRKAILMGPPRPHSFTGWASPSPPSFPPPSPPPPASPRQSSTPASSSQRSCTSHIQDGGSNSRGSSGISRLSTSTRDGCVGQRTPRPYNNRHQRSSSRHSHHTPSPRPSSHRRIVTPQPRTPPSNSVSGSNIVRPHSVPVPVFNMHDYRNRDNNPSLNSLDRASKVEVIGRISPVGRRSRHHQDQSRSPNEDRRHSDKDSIVDRRSPAIIHVEANIREGPRRSSRRDRGGDRNDRGRDGDDSSGSNRRNEKYHHRGQRTGGLQQFLRCLPFSPWSSRKSGDGDGGEATHRSRPGSHNRRSGRR